MGLLEEVSWLYQEHPQAQAPMGIGYKEFFPYFAGELSLEEAVDKVKQNSRRRQTPIDLVQKSDASSLYSVGEPDYKLQIFTAVEEFLND